MSNLDEVRERIEAKFRKALWDSDEGDLVMPFVRLALLDMQAVFEAGGVVEKQVAPHHYDLVGWALRLNEWLAEYAVDLYHEPYTDTGEAMVKAADRLRGQVVKLRHELATAIDERNAADRATASLEEDLEAARRELAALIAERDGLRQQLAEVDADNAAMIRGNGKSAPAAVLVQAFDNGQANQDYIGLDWSSLTPAAQDYRIGLDHNRWKWRDIPKKIRLELVRCVIANAGEFPTQAEFDAIRPQWMATADAQKTAFGVPWGILTNHNREIEVKP